MLLNSKIGNYTLLKLLGKGVIGETYLAEQRFYNSETGEPIINEYSVKTVNLKQAQEYGITSNDLIGEIKALESVSKNPVCNQYISCYYEYIPFSIETDDWIGIITDYIPGKSLQEIILNAATPIGLSDILKIMNDISEALGYIHLHDIVHQNLKPSNIIHDAKNNRYRIIDFTFSCHQAIERACKGKYINVYYTAPDIIEAMSDNSPISFKQRLAHDIWSAGVIFYQLANMGEFPIALPSNNDLNQVKKDIRLEPVNPGKYDYQPVNGVIATMLNKDWKSRPTAQQLHILIENARPLCIINNQSINFEKGVELAVALGIYNAREMTSLELCEKLTNELQICNLSNEKYQKQHLDQIAKILGIAPIQNSAALCQKIQVAIETENNRYRTLVTGELITTLENLINLNANAETANTSSELIQKLEEKYIEIYTIAVQLQLIDEGLIANKINQLQKIKATFETAGNNQQVEVYNQLINTLSLFRKK